MIGRRACIPLSSLGRISEQIRAQTWNGKSSSLGKMRGETCNPTIRLAG